jgi:hypothetical protein
MGVIGGLAQVRMLLTFRKVGTMDLDLMFTRQSHNLAFCYTASMPNRLHHYYGAGSSHTSSLPVVITTFTP